jgi:hypothetical protein
MRLLFALLFILHGVNGLGQNLKFPFQIIYCEGVTNRSGETVRGLDLIWVDEILAVSRDGILAMIHYSGVPVEVMGDTTLMVKDLQVRFNLLFKSVQTDHRFKRPDIEYLFIDGYDRAARARVGWVPVNRESPLVDLLYPPSFKWGATFVSHDVCFRWTQTGAKAYTVELRNIFEDVLATYKVPSSELMIPAAEMDSIWTDGSPLVLTISAERLRIRDQLIMRVPDEFKNYPFGCSLDKATYALVAALHVEKSVVERKPDAERYFKLAAELSDRPFFKTMLDNFYKRWSR